MVLCFLISKTKTSSNYNFKVFPLVENHPVRGVPSSKSYGLRITQKTQMHPPFSLSIVENGVISKRQETFLLNLIDSKTGLKPQSGKPLLERNT